MAASAQVFLEETSFIADLPKVEWHADTTVLHWKDFWLLPDVIKAVPAIENQFKPLPTDVLVASFPKTGTTWLKALAASILSHNSKPKPDFHADPLQKHSPHELVHFLEMETFGEKPSQDIKKVPSPRVFSTHRPYSILPEHVKNSGCSIIYIVRNPADTFVSGWHFYNKRGVVPGGPFC